MHRTPATCCTVCGTRTYTARDPRRSACSICHRQLCPAHTWYYVDEDSPAITRNAPPTCGQCIGLTVTRCPVESCTHVIQERTAAASANALTWHLERAHDHTTDSAE